MRRLHRLMVTVAALAALGGLLGGCASTPPAAGISGTGTVVGIQETMEASQTNSTVGAIGGALLGGLIGSQIGDGAGRTVATAVGTVGGSVVGSNVAGKSGQKMVWVVGVRFEDGIDRSIKVTERPNFRPGDKVRVEQGVIKRL
jgi:outer membrane lipoprotein SlyB